MWSKGSIEIDGTKVQYWVKHYERGWDMEPETELGYRAYAIMMKMYN